MLDRYGFDVVYERYCGFYRSVESIAYTILVLRHQWPSVYRLMKRAALTRRGLYMNMYDIVYVIACKR